MDTRVSKSRSARRDAENESHNIGRRGRGIGRRPVRASVPDGGDDHWPRNSGGRLGVVRVPELARSAAP